MRLLRMWPLSMLCVCDRSICTRSTSCCSQLGRPDNLCRMPSSCLPRMVPTTLWWMLRPCPPQWVLTPLKPVHSQRTGSLGSNRSSTPLIHEATYQVWPLTVCAVPSRHWPQRRLQCPQVSYLTRGATWRACPSPWVHRHWLVHHLQSAMGSFWIQSWRRIRNWSESLTRSMPGLSRTYTRLQ